MNMGNKMREDLTDVLNEIDDPELGIGIVDMGLIYRAQWNAKGIDVEFTTTSPSCPFEEILFQDINDILSHRFREATSICVRFVLDPPWTLERLSENARRKLGWTRTADESSAHSSAAPGKAKLSRRCRTANFVRPRNFIN
jgi:metal-sulfur cluster biosynthetic enzyme